MIKDSEFYTPKAKPTDALDCLHWLIDALPPEGWESLPEALQTRIIELTGSIE